MKLTSNDVGADVYLSVMTEQRDRELFTLKHCGQLLLVQVVICNRQSSKANTPSELFMCVYCKVMQGIFKVNRPRISVTEHKTLIFAY